MRFPRLLAVLGSALGPALALGLPSVPPAHAQPGQGTGEAVVYTGAVV